MTANESIQVKSDYGIYLGIEGPPASMTVAEAEAAALEREIGGSPLPVNISQEEWLKSGAGSTGAVRKKTEQKTGAVDEDGTPVKRFASGAIRSSAADHARYDLIPRAGLELIGRTLSHGEKRYGAGNWKKGIPEADLVNHCLQHVYKWADGDRSEDHIGHALCNLLFLAHFKYDECLKIYEQQNNCNDTL